MASKRFSSLEDAQKKLAFAANHLVTCGQCRCKMTSEIVIMSKQLEEMQTIVDNCRNIAREILQKDDKIPIQAKPSGKLSRVVIKWK